MPKIEFTKAQLEMVQLAVSDFITGMGDDPKSWTAGQWMAIEHAQEKLYPKPNS